MKDRFFALTIVGGKGKRLMPLTEKKPKPLVKINGKPIIEHQINWMKSQGITDVLFLCGYKGKLISDYFGDCRKFGINAHYSFEDKPLGRGGAIKNAINKIPKEINQFLVTNGDVLTTQSLKPILNTHNTNDSLATVMTVPYPNQYGLVEIKKNGTVHSFNEKTKIPFYINSGIYYFEKSIHNYLPIIGDHETLTFPDLVKKNKISGYVSKSFWTSIESHKELDEVEKKLQSGKITF